MLIIPPVTMGSLPDWLPPFLVAAFSVFLLNAAWLVQRRRIRRQAWDQRFMRELQGWDGRLPAEFERLP